ncbi:phosphatidylinositol/phosphatidylcholine transfer protein SFH11 isoform X2 [Cucurbita pepo subsp. pepo]|uniref:phosphatidylinositol/phosphatidylcholine transfer protein SFH11 isoform X2 n=1 Tax=Cucurbita pepo subsp. pepo TaxID=3664 RepID=UPI000C9DA44C|nr:phosphatidylinositol/phosphatidylcholine transfer protein SFH11 isoform X2 [Cucurbita pepo subsp. pepo]
MDAPKGRGLGSKLLHPLRLRRSSRGSLKRAMEEKHDPKDEEAVDKLREMLFLEGQLPTKFNDYHTLLRFLRMRDFDTTAAKDMFLKFIKWREDFRTDAISKGVSNFSKPARYLFTEIQKIDSNYYPETLNQLFIVNAGSGFKILWKALRAFLDARTLAKIHVLGNNFVPELREIIDPSNLPNFLGGNCCCSEYGGCLSSDRGPWNNPTILAMVQVLSSADETYDNEEESGLASEDARLDNRKIEAFEGALAEAKKKIEALETALEDTKLILKDLTQHIEDLRT